MNKSIHIEHSQSMRRRPSSAWGLAMAVLIAVSGAAGTAAVSAQSTAGSVFGHAPAGQAVTAKSNISGLTRHVKADSKGRYNISALPVGTYTVIMGEEGGAIEKQLNVPVTVGRGSKVDFSCPQDQCAAGNQ